MATKTATVRYASRGTVNGSNAYDLSRVREYYGDAPEIEKNPTKRPETPAVSRPAAKPGSRTGRRAQKSYGLSLFAVTGFVVVAVMMVFVLLAHVKYDEVTNETGQLRTQLEALNEEERKLKIAYEDAFDVNEVEQYATKVLKMTKPTETQVVSVAATAEDKAVLVTAQQDNTNVTESMATFLASLVEYFK